MDATSSQAEAEMGPEFVEAQQLLAVEMYETGDFEAAVKHFSRALISNPDHKGAWSNIFFPLKALQLRDSSLNDSLRSSFEFPDSVSFAAEFSLLNYKLHRGTETASQYLEEAFNSLSIADHAGIKSANQECKKLDTSVPEFENVVALLHFGRSGTGLLHSLFDGHSEVSTLPSIYFSEFFDSAIWNNVMEDSWDKMADRFISMYPVLFDAASSNPVPAAAGGSIADLGRSEGMANVGEGRNAVLSLDKDRFRSKLIFLMERCDKLNAFQFFKLIHFAYEKTLDKRGGKSVLFYHIHNPDTYAKLNFARLAPDASWLMMVREPLQSCESWINSAFQEQDYSDIATRIYNMIFAIQDDFFDRNRSIGVRLEDLKQNPKGTIRALCGWMGIEEEDVLYRMTAQGKKWWGDPSSPDFGKEEMTPFGKSSINREVGMIFSESDQFVLQTLFYPFSVRFGYVEENLKKFKTDLKAIRPMIDEMFDFEKRIVEAQAMDPAQFMRSGSYCYLRAGMVDRWNTLVRFSTYPNMFRALRIDT